MDVIFRLKNISLVERYKVAINWIKKNSITNEGICVTSEQKVSYPEVTGYYIPTLLLSGERELAVQYAKWLVNTQCKDGSWCAPNSNIPYTFDIGQILKGLLALVDQYPEFKDSIIRGCNWILSQVHEDGRLTTPDTRAWLLPNGSMVPEAIHLYVLEPIKMSGLKWNIPKYLESVEKVLNYYLRNNSLTEFNTLSHFHAYIIEALVDLNCISQAKDAMLKIRELMNKDGSIPAYKDVKWICSTGMFQYALIFYKLGDFDNANKVFNYACKLQNRSGGFYGGYGRKATYFPEEEISWALKYFLDAFWWNIKSDFNATVEIYSETIGECDGRYICIKNNIEKTKPKNAIDIGCGKGRYINRIKKEFSDIEAYGLDLSENMLKYLSKEVNAIQGSFLDIPIENDYFDLAFCIESLEHAVNIDNAVKELSRIIKPGGTLIVIDKNINKLKEHKISQWEQWFSKENMNNVLVASGFKSVNYYENIPYDDVKDGLFICWVASK